MEEPSSIDKSLGENDILLMPEVSTSDEVTTPLSADNDALPGVMLQLPESYLLDTGTLDDNLNPLDFEPLVKDNLCVAPSATNEEKSNESMEDSATGNLEESTLIDVDKMLNGTSQEAQVENQPDLEIIPSPLESLSEPIKNVQKKAGPPPGLLPIDQNSHSATPESPEGGSGRVPRKAALKSAERTKIVAQVEKTKGQYDLASLEEAKGMGDADATNVTMNKIIDPIIEFCHGCNKEECCLFQTIGRHSKAQLKFCSRKCVQNFFKYGNIHFPNPHQDEDIIVEPDIEIQTLSDEFQMDCEDAEPSNTIVDLEIESVARETLVCVTCKTQLYNRDGVLQWEAKEFCSEKCLKMYVKVVGSHCNMCNSIVPEALLGKLCVRFGTIIRQFCAAVCLDKFKHSHKLCAQCQTNMPDRDKKFCSAKCEELCQRLQNPSFTLGSRTCAVCNEEKPIIAEVIYGNQSRWLCSTPCLNAFRFANKLTTLNCTTCRQYFDSKVTPRHVSRNPQKSLSSPATDNLDWFCSEVCFATHLLSRRSIEQCPRCSVKKYNVDMVRKPTGKIAANRENTEPEFSFYCSLVCLSLSSTLMQPREPGPTRKKTMETSSTAPPQKQSVPPAIQPTATPVASVRTVPVRPMGPSPVIRLPLHPTSFVAGGRPMVVIPTNNQSILTQAVGSTGPTVAPIPQSNTIIPIDVQHKIIFVPPSPKEMKNKSVSCRPENLTNGSSEVDDSEPNKRPLYIPILIPIPVPIYVPIPMAMYNCPAPFPVGYPVPLPTPVLIPVEPDIMAQVAMAMNESAKEAAEIAAAIEESANEANIASQKLDFEDLEQIIPSSSLKVSLDMSPLGRKRSHSTSHPTASTPSPKRLRESEPVSNRSCSDGEDSNQPITFKKGSFHKDLGTRAWSQWVEAKRAKNKGSSVVFTQNLSNMNLRDMNKCLVEFTRDARKPNGESYRPDVLLYIFYGLQLDFGTSQRRENLFMDAALEPFQEELDKHLKPFYDTVLDVLTSAEDGSAKKSSHSVLMTCLKESYLWDCRQLGVDSPIVLIFTMLYFNTKFFRLYTAEQHEQLSFSNVTKVPQKRPLIRDGIPHNGSPVLSKAASKIYCLQLAQDALKQNGSKIVIKKPLEQPQLVETPAICPIRHYNFYLMKCPESARLRRDVFYLMPETSCTPDSHVWYSTEPVPRRILNRMLRRVLLVEEVLRNLCALD